MYQFSEYRDILGAMNTPRAAAPTIPDTAGDTPALRLFALVEVLAGSDRRHSLQSLVDETGLPKPTLHRMLQQLESAGMLLRESDGRHYGTGPRLRRLAENLLLHDTLHGARHAVLRSLVQEVGESCNITALSGSEVVYLDRVETAAPLRFYLHAGSRVPAHCSASGKVLLAQSDMLGKQIAEAVTETVIGLSGGYDAILIPATSSGKNYAPRIAAKLDVAPISEIIEVIDGSTFVRPIYAGNALETVQSADAKKVITVRATAFKAAGEGGSAAIETVTGAGAQAHTRFVSDEIVKSDRPELSAAKIVVSGGRAMGSAEEFQRVIEPLADKLGAAVGASRAAVDAGYAPNDYQVGQTGKVVAPQLYVAIGISGAIQHLAGMKDSKVIVAINKDADAPIFQVADFGLVADYKTAVPELMDELAKAGV